MRRLDGRIALVTGGSNGIGKATALRLADEGATVVVTDIQDGPGEAVAAQINESGGRAVYLHHDVAVEQEWEEVLATVEREFGALDILVNNAGVGHLESLEESTTADYERTIAITQTSVFHGMRLAAPLLKRSAHASVINISSIFGVSGGFGMSPAYHAAKGAVRMLTKNTALHWAPEGIRVNSIHPGFVVTSILDSVMGTPFEQVMTDLTPMGRLGQPEEIAAGVAYLASDDASFVTGSELHIDGGYLAR
jgi:NAD(P)-dependent dehydrogenase (short-subunit alcohol dehydrogenase family)